MKPCLPIEISLFLCPLLLIPQLSIYTFFCVFCLFVCFLRWGFSVTLEPVLELALEDQAGLELAEIHLPSYMVCFISDVGVISY